MNWRQRIGFVLIICAEALWKLKNHFIRKLQNGSRSLTSKHEDTHPSSPSLSQKILSFLSQYSHIHTPRNYMIGGGIFILILLATALYPEIKQTFFNQGQGINQTTNENNDEGDIIIPETENSEEEGRISPEDSLTSTILTVTKGMTLDEVIQKSGVEKEEKQSIISAIRTYFNPKDLTVGQELIIRTDTNNRLYDLQFNVDQTQIIWVRNNQEQPGYQSELVKIPTINKTLYAKGLIENSLYIDAVNQGIPANVIVQMIKIFSYDVDFQRDFQKGDSFELFYDITTNVKGEAVGEGAIKMASLTLNKKEITYYRYETQNKKGQISVEFFTEEGKTARKGLLRTPVDGARLSSSYGMRKHPVLGYSKMHKGVDFAAPIGTPIYAAGDGIVDYAGRFSTYGNYVRIKHAGGYSTAYAHMNKINKGIVKGARVKQYQKIGQVGMTGRSTGPHLHYEILVNKKQVNPMKVKVTTSTKLSGDALKKFLKQKDNIKSQIAQHIKGDGNPASSLLTTITKGK